MWEIIGAISGAIAVVGLYYQFVVLPKREEESMRSTLMAQFKISRYLCTKLIADINEYADTHDCRRHQYFQGATFDGQLKHLAEIKGKSLNDDLLAAITTMPITKELYDTMMSSLQEQINSFNKDNAYFNTFRFRE